MLQRCGGNGGSGAATSFSIFFPVTSKQGVMEEGSSSAAASSVDCTLSLGTPSTRHGSTKSSSFCYNVISQTSNKHAASGHGGSRVPSAANGSNNSLGGDPLLLARRCANCDTTSTPLWRNGPGGPKSLCNACGIRYKKEERRAAASSSSPSTNEAIGYSYHQQQQQSQYPWSCYPSPAAKNPTTFGELRMGREQWCGQNNDDVDMDQVPYLSWRLNVVPPQFPVTERPSLFQYQ